jgi:hypothetical protein
MGYELINNKVSDQAELDNTRFAAIKTIFGNQGYSLLTRDPPLT